MTFTVTDYEREAHSCTHWVRCDGCGQTELVYDQPSDERAIERAEYNHGDCRACVACGESLDKADLAFNVLACLGCRTDDPEGTEAAVTAHIEAMTASEMRAYLERVAS